jgi:tripartite ATP-independent transporter DctP family solute receptor
VLVVAAALGASACGVGGEESGLIELKLGHVANPGSLVAESSEEFARRVNEQLAGRVKVIVFGSSQLGSDEVLLQKLKLGTVDLAAPSTIMSSVDDAFAFFEMPYLVENREHMKRIGDGIFWPHIAPKAEAKGYKVLGLWENGFRQITNNARPIVTPADLAGIKLRTPRGVWRVKLFQTYGANPTPMALSEVFVALQTGVLDGQENPLTQIHSSKFQEAQKYLSMTNHVYTPDYLLSGMNRYNRLPADVREVLEKTGRDLQPWVYETAARLDGELLADLKKSGMAVNEADRASFVAASKAIYDEFGKAVPGGEQWVEQALALAKQ